MAHVNDFEKMLTDNGIILLKFYFSISKETQNKRFKEIKNSALKKMEVLQKLIAKHKNYQQYTKYKDEIFELTNSSYAPWKIIIADRKIYARIKTIKLILETIDYDKSTEIHNKNIDF